MGNVFTVIKYSAEVVTYVGKLALGDAVSGAGRGSYGTRITVLNDEQDSLAQTILDVMESLILSVDKIAIAANDIDTAVISMSTIDNALDWLLVVDDEIWGSGTELAVAGLISMNFSIDTPGRYEIWFVRRVGDYATGKVIVEAT